MTFLGGLGVLLLALGVDDLSIELRGVTALPREAVDQHGQAFTVTGLSAVVQQDDGVLLAVMDNSDKLVRIEFVLGPDGTPESARLGTGISLSHSMDFEGLALSAEAGVVILCEEGTPGLQRHRLSDGALLGALPVPAVFRAARPNRGFESCARSRDQRTLWVANEEALTVDGPGSSVGAGTVVRLLRFDLARPEPAPGGQFAYRVEPVHAGRDDRFAASGLVDLVALPDGQLLALERSSALAPSPFLSRIYALDFEGASDVSGLAALKGAQYSPVTKRLLWSGRLGNLEGLTLGPKLPTGGWALLGVVDDGDPLSKNSLVAFQLRGLHTQAGEPELGQQNEDGGAARSRTTPPTHRSAGG